MEDGRLKECLPQHQKASQQSMLETPRVLRSVFARHPHLHQQCEYLPHLQPLHETAELVLLLPNLPGLFVVSYPLKPVAGMGQVLTAREAEDRRAS